MPDETILSPEQPGYLEQRKKLGRREASQTQPKPLSAKERAAKAAGQATTGAEVVGSSGEEVAATRGRRTVGSAPLGQPNVTVDTNSDQV